MAKTIDPIGAYFCTSLRQRLAEIRTQIEWLASGAAPVLSVDDEMDGLASRIWDLERMLKDITHSSEGKPLNARAAMLDQGPTLPNTAAVIQMGQRNDKRPPLRSNETWKEAVA